MKKADGGAVNKRKPKEISEIARSSYSDLAVDSIKDFQDAAEEKYKKDTSIRGLLNPKNFVKEFYDEDFTKKQKRMKNLLEKAYYEKHRTLPDKKKKQEEKAEKKMRHAEKYAPGLSLDMEDKPAQAPMSKYAKGGAAVKKAVHKHEKAMHPGKPLTKLKKGGVPAYGRKAMYGGGKC